MQNVCTAQRQPSYSTMVESPVRMANTPRGPGTIRTIHHGLTAFKHLQDLLKIPCRMANHANLR
jgi:hypothetical protein